MSITTYALKVKSLLLNIYTLFLISYILIGFSGYLFRLGDQLHYKASILLLLRQFIATFPIIYFAYFSTKVFALKDKTSQYVNYILYTIIFTNIATALTPILGITSFYSHASNYLVHGERVGGFFANANEAGIFGNYLVVIFFVFYLKKPKYKWLTIPLLLLGSFNAVASFSKAAILVVPIIIIYYLFFSLLKLKNYSPKNRKGFFRVSLLISIITFFLFINFNAYYDSLETSKQKRLTNSLAIATGDINSATTSKRSELFWHGIKKISRNPLVGYGMGSFHQFIDGPYELGIHNSFLLIIGESGFIPFLLFITMLLLLFKYGYHHLDYKISFFITASVLIFIINLYGTSNNTIVDRPSNILLGVFFALIENRKEKIN